MSFLIRRANGQIEEMTQQEIDAMQPSLFERQKTAAMHVNEIRDQKLQSFAYDFGLPHGVLHLQIRDAMDKANWLTLSRTVHALISAGQGDALIPLRTEENITVTLAATMVDQVLNSMSSYGAAVLAASWTLKDAIKDSTEPELIDIQAGWPA